VLSLVLVGTFSVAKIHLGIGPLTWKRIRVVLGIGLLVVVAAFLMRDSVHPQSGGSDAQSGGSDGKWN